MKPFDEKFADNVREAFDHWRQEMPPHAWEDMKARLDGKDKARRVAFWPFFAKAASVALLVGMSIYLYVGFSPKGDALIATRQHEAAATEITKEEPLAGAETVPPETTAGLQQIAKPIRTAAETGLKSRTDTTPPPAEKPAIEAILLADSQLPAPSPETNEEQTPETLPGNREVTPDAERQNNREGAKLAISNEPERAPAEEAPDPGRFSWGIAAGSMLAFAENSVSDAPGYNAGIMAGFALTDQISLTSGTLLTYHKFELVNFANADFAADYLPDNASMTNVSLTGNNQYEMLALEIPLNAQFSIMETRSRSLFVSGGLSSMLYLQQRFTGVNTAFFEKQVFNAVANRYEKQYSATTFEVDEKYPALSRFDFGRLLNLSLGYVVQRPNGAMVIEPFVKIPLGAITSRNISLGMGGISLKYRFSGN